MVASNRIALLQQQQAEQQSLKAKKSDTPPEWLRHRPPANVAKATKERDTPSEWLRQRPQASAENDCLILTPLRCPAEATNERSHFSHWRGPVSHR